MSVGAPYSYWSQVSVVFVQSVELCTIEERLEGSWQMSIREVVN